MLRKITFAALTSLGLTAAVPAAHAGAVAVTIGGGYAVPAPVVVAPPVAVYYGPTYPAYRYYPTHRVYRAPVYYRGHRHHGYHRGYRR